MNKRQIINRVIRIVNFRISNNCIRLPLNDCSKQTINALIWYELQDYATPIYDTMNMMEYIKAKLCYVCENGLNVTSIGIH